MFNLALSLSLLISNSDTFNLTVDTILREVTQIEQEAKVQNQSLQSLASRYREIQIESYRLYLQTLARAYAVPIADLNKRINSSVEFLRNNISLLSLTSTLSEKKKFPDRLAYRDLGPFSGSYSKHPESNIYDYFELLKSQGKHSPDTEISLGNDLKNAENLYQSSARGPKSISEANEALTKIKTIVNRIKTEAVIMQRSSRTNTLSGETLARSLTELQLSLSNNLAANQQTLSRLSQIQSNLFQLKSLSLQSATNSAARN